MSRFFRWILIAAVVVLPLAGCGNKGALVLPDQPAAAKKHKPATPEQKPATPPAPAPDSGNPETH
jgi:predicted small lipoprotein YifL